MVLPTDAALFEDPSFKVMYLEFYFMAINAKVLWYTKITKTLWNNQVYAEKYAEDQEAFFKDYAEAHAKLSNLGAKFDPPEVCSFWVTVTVFYKLR